MTVCQNVVEIEGLEPSLTEPESVVLPLHHISIWLPFLNFGTAKVLMFCENAKYFYKKMMLRVNDASDMTRDFVRKPLRRDL